MNPSELLKNILKHIIYRCKYYLRQEFRFLSPTPFDSRLWMPVSLICIIDLRKYFLILWYALFLKANKKFPDAKGYIKFYSETMISKDMGWASNISSKVFINYKGKILNLQRSDLAYTILVKWLRLISVTRHTGTVNLQYDAVKGHSITSVYLCP